jgi:tRNA (cmo5U34)-methyltransferase
MGEVRQSDNTTPHKSSDYDRKVRQTIPFYETMYLEVVDLVKEVKPDVTCWLDTGCGTGYLVEVALPFFPQTLFLLADPSEAMLQHAAKRFQGVGNTQLQFLQPVESKRLASQIGGVVPQVVTAIQCHHYLEPLERHKAVQSCYDILEDGGLFITFENITPCTERGVQIGLGRWKRFQMGQGRSLPTVENHLKRFGVNYFPIPASEHVELLQAVGFQIVELFWLSQMQAGFYAIK